jgi:DNA-binding transcriptional LysR family regulator
MNMSQSAMSNALTRLRAYFDDALLVQVGRRMELTPRADAMRHSVRDILVRVEATISSEVEFDPSTSTREFRILLSDYSMTTVMPRVLALAARRQARVRFRLLPQTEFPYVSIERGDADLLIAPGMFVSRDHPNELLYEDNFVCVAWARGRFGRGTLSEEDYRGARHVRMVPPTVPTSFETEFLAQHGIEHEIEVCCYSFAALPHLVVGTDRLATVHGLLARQAATGLPITVHKLPFSAPALDQRIQWHAHKNQDPGIRWLRSLMLEVAQALPTEAKLSRT